MENNNNFENAQNNNELVPEVEVSRMEAGIEPNSPETVNGLNVEQRYDYNKKFNSEKPKKKGGKFKKGMSYIAVGLICATIGSAASGAAILYGLPNTSLFKNSGLYKTIMEGTNSNVSKTVYDGHPTQLASTTGAMTVSDIAKKVGPAVVAITSTVQGRQDFFGNARTQQAVGTGMIINQDGYILTNYHVVQGAQKVTVRLSSGKQVNARVVNYDANYDVAVVKITDSVKVPATVELGDSDNLQVGESVVAIGNPLGTDFFGSVTSGVVSAVNRKLDGDANSLSYIQTDAAINSGNSGGPLINSAGKVIGINTAKINETGVEGLGFAIPINAVKNKIPDLSKPILMIGIQGEDIDADLSSQYNLPVGVYVDTLVQGSPAALAGLQHGDVIVKFDGQKVTSVNDLNAIKNKHKAGDKVAVTINRNGTQQTLTLTLTAQ